MKSGHPCGPNESYGESNVTLKRPHSEAFQIHDYQYSSLGHDHIRLFKLHPGGRAQELEGNFFESDGHDDYEVLTHERDPPDSSSSVTILSNGEAHRKAIRPSLEKALRELRLPDRARVLWVLTLCINEKNEGEKSIQVIRMGRTYEEASNVCIWLGPESPQTSQAFSLIKKALHYDFLLGWEPSSVVAADWVALTEIMKHPWFARVWSVVTISTARQAAIYYGRESIRWRDFVAAVLICQAHAEHFQEFLKAAYGHRHIPIHLARIKVLHLIDLIDLESGLFRRSPDGTIMERLLPLETVVSKLGTFYCANPRDFIYAALLLSSGVRPYVSRSGDEIESHQDERRTRLTVVDDFIAPNLHYNSLAKSVIRRLREPVLSTRFTIDYSKSSLQVYQDFYEFVFRRTRSLDVLFGAQLPGPGLPSWISSKEENAPFQIDPDVGHVRINADPLLNSHLEPRTIYRAAGGTHARWRFGVESQRNSLFVSGFVLDTVNLTLPPAIMGIIPFEWLTLLRATRDTSDVSSNLDLVWRVLVADRCNNGQAAPPYYRAACDNVLSRYASRRDVYISDILRHEKNPLVRSFLERVQSVIWRRTLVSSTTYELTGLAPSTIRRDDLFCILYGCSVPVVLRRSDPDPVKDTDRLPGEQYYQLIGACYIDGMMEGEALKVKNEQDLRLQEFEIR